MSDENFSNKPYSFPDRVEWGALVPLHRRDFNVYHDNSLLSEVICYVEIMEKGVEVVTYKGQRQ